MTHVWLAGLLAYRVRARKGVWLAELPSGTVTFLFTDLEGSSRLWEEHRDAMRCGDAPSAGTVYDPCRFG